PPSSSLSSLSLHDALPICPNQIFVASLPKSPLTPEQQRAVVDVCARRLVTSHGLRSGAGRAGLSRALRRCPSRPRRSLSPRDGVDRKSTRLNSSHRTISYA